MKPIRTMLTAGLLLATIPPAPAGELLSDDELGEITAGTASAVYDDGRLYFDLNKTTGRGTRLEALGDLNFNVDTVGINTGVLRLEDNAQGNLRALVNTNAVNSPVQVLINLNINVNSRVDVLNQVNNALQQK